ncbi:MAG: hypothetical protein AAB131_21545, partial [Actinomycetota bacterium]
TPNPNDFDVIFGGQGDDDLIGSPGMNQLFAWSRDPDPTVTQLHFLGEMSDTGTGSTPATLRGYAPAPSDGQLRADMHVALSIDGGADIDVHVAQSVTQNNTSLSDLVADVNNALNAAGLGGQVVAGFVTESGKRFFTLAKTATGGSLTLRLRQFGVFVGSLHDDNGDLDGDGFLDSDGVSAPRQLEDTGLDRMLGSEEDDELYGGTGLGFLFGNGGDAKLFRADGSLFESLDGGLLGEDWKNYARETGQVWYIGATDADDVITVDYVTEPGIARDHHLVTRLTNNNGNFSFAAQINLDFNAEDSNGNPIWDPDDIVVDLDALEARTQAQDPENPTDQELAAIQYQQLNLEESLLPPEGNFEVILIDAMDGNDQVYVGPTVQKTV